MDALDRVHLTAADLLDRVDTALAGGAPAGHRVWPLLRWIRLLPGPAVRCVVELRSYESPAVELSVLSDAVAEAAEPLAAPVTWEGSAGAAVQAMRSAQLDHLTGTDESVAVRIADFSSYLEEIGFWIAESRVSLAMRLATALQSEAAITLLTSHDPLQVGLAAADIGAEVLAEVEEILREGERLEEDWSARLEALRPPARPTDLPGPSTNLRLDL
jgi:hypothetical protein